MTARPAAGPFRTNPFSSFHRSSSMNNDNNLGNAANAGTRNLADEALAVVEERAMFARWGL